MCGVLGMVDSKPIERELFTRMRDTMVHRGPDDTGCYFSANGKIALGHRRLSIIDLSDQGRQPLSNEDGTVWLSFNGEIYNYQELRATLSAKGHRFRSETDSETIVHAYEEWGEECLDRLWGMFAFVVWDERNRVMFGGRDRLGVKPLHYWHAGETFICASEIKAIVEYPDVARHLDRSALCDFLTYRYIPSPKTIWKEVRKVPPGHAFAVRDGVLRIWRYWSLPYGERGVSEDEAAQQLEALLIDAVKRRLVSDVPLGLFLSSGLDSASVAWAMHELKAKIRTFTVGFEGSDQDETAGAVEVADYFHTERFEKKFTLDELRRLDDLMWYFDEPFGASSMLPTYLLSRMAKQHVTVALSGDGGDEVLAGYNWYGTLMKPVVNPAIAGEDLVSRYRRATTPRFERSELARLLPEPLDDVESDELWFFRQAMNPSLSGVKQLQWLDMQTFLPEEVLTKVDRASMASSLEVRSPFLDHRLFELIFSLSADVYYGGTQKRLLKAMLVNRLPPQVFNRKKRGFSAPVQAYWGDEKVNRLLKESAAVKDGVLRPGVVRSLMEPSSSHSTYARRWLLLIFDLWYRRWEPVG